MRKTFFVLWLIGMIAAIPIGTVGGLIVPTVVEVSLEIAEEEARELACYAEGRGYDLPFFDGNECPMQKSAPECRIGGVPVPCEEYRRTF